MSPRFGGQRRKRGDILLGSDFWSGIGQVKEEEMTSRPFQMVGTAHAKAEGQEKTVSFGTRWLHTPKEWSAERHSNAVLTCLGLIFVRSFWMSRWNPVFILVYTSLFWASLRLAIEAIEQWTWRQIVQNLINSLTSGSSSTPPLYSGDSLTNSAFSKYQQIPGAWHQGGL